MTTIDATTGDAHASVANGRVTDIEWRSGPALPTDAPRTVLELIAGCLRDFPDATVVRDAGRTASWRELDAWSARLAAVWAGRLAPGERCAVLVPNGLPHLIAELACWRLGAVAAPVFLGFGAERVTGLLARLEPRVALVDDPQIARLLPDGVQRVSTADLWQAVARTSARVVDRAVVASDPCLIQFTSGSTGVPRGVVLTHGNLASQQAAFALHWPEIGPGDRLAAYLPWHHSFGGLAERLWALCRGADLTVVPGGGRDRRQLIDTIRRVAPTVFLSVPKIHAVVMEERLLAGGGVRWVFTAGAPMPDDLRRWYAQQGIAVGEGWGLTETSPSCTLTRPGEGRSGVVGWPIAGVSVGVRGSDGRILVRGPNVMAGYFRQETTTLNDGVLDTGDLGAWTVDGLCLRGRADHQLKLGNGEKVCAATMEASLHAHPAIHHAVVAAEPELLVIVEVQDGHAASDVLAVVDVLNAGQDVPYQRIAAIYGVTRRMSVENGQLTPSLKVSRGQVMDMFRRWRCEGGTEFVRYR